MYTMIDGVTDVLGKSMSPGASSDLLRWWTLSSLCNTDTDLVLAWQGNSRGPSAIMCAVCALHLRTVTTALTSNSHEIWICILLLIKKYNFKSCMKIYKS